MASFISSSNEERKLGNLRSDKGYNYSSELNVPNPYILLIDSEELIMSTLLLLLCPLRLDSSEF